MRYIDVHTHTHLHAHGSGAEPSDYAHTHTHKHTHTHSHDTVILFGRGGAVGADTVACGKRKGSPDGRRGADEQGGKHRGKG